MANAMHFPQQELVAEVLGGGRNAELPLYTDILIPEGQFDLVPW